MSRAEPGGLVICGFYRLGRKIADTKSECWLTEDYQWRDRYLSAGCGFAMSIGAIGGETDDLALCLLKAAGLAIRNAEKFH